MFDYNALAADAAEMLVEFGAPVVLERTVPGDYDPTIAEPDDEGTQVFNTMAVRDKFKFSEIDGTNVLAMDVRLLVSGLLATEPKPGDALIFGGERFKVVSSRPVKPATIVVLHDVQCRNA